MGGLTAVHQFCRLGRYAITGGCSKIVQDVPPFMIADGNPAKVRGINVVGLERSGFAPETIKAIKEAFRLIYRSKYNTRQAIEAIQQELPASAEITQIRGVYSEERTRDHSLGRVVGAVIPRLATARRGTSQSQNRSHKRRFRDARSACWRLSPSTFV